MKSRAEYLEEAPAVPMVVAGNFTVVGLLGRGSMGEVKVMDFGLAYQAAKSVPRLTRAPSWGTPPYMAPEQELGGVSRAVDVYALAPEPSRRFAGAAALAAACRALDG